MSVLGGRGKVGLLQECGVGAVALVALGQGLMAGREFEFGMIREKGGDEFRVFLGLDGAGRIHDPAAGFQAGQGVFENLSLEFDQLADVCGAESPADIDASAKNSGVRAGDIEQDGIEGAPPLFRRGLGPVVDFDACLGAVESFEVALESWQAFVVGIGAKQVLGRSLCGGDEECLSSGGGAGIEHFFAGAWGKELDRVMGGRVLDVDFAFREEIGRDGAVDFVEACRELGGGRVLWCGGSRGERIDAGEGWGGRVIEIHQCDGVFLAEGFLPAFEEPVGVRVEDFGCHVFEVVEFFAGGDGAS